MRSFSFLSRLTLNSKTKNHIPRMRFFFPIRQVGKILLGLQMKVKNVSKRLFVYSSSYLIFILLFFSHPKYRQALEAKLPFLVCGSTEDKSAAGSSAETVSATSDGTQKAEEKA